MEYKKLSSSSPLRTGLYKKTQRMFFVPSKLFEAQVTELFDGVWPVVTALKMLRWQVKGYYEEYCIGANSRLTEKFVEKEDIVNRPNLYRVCLDEEWGETEFKIAKNLLTNIFACYEGWCSNIIEVLSLRNTQKGKKFQFPISVADFNSIICNGNSDLITAFYEKYKSRSKNYNIAHLNNWLKFYRYFKECRNAIIHNGGQTTQNVINAYDDIKDLELVNLDVEEIPRTFNTEINSPIQLSLRGVIGFSQMVIKIVATLDVELIKAKNADRYYSQIVKEAVGHRIPYEPSRYKRNVVSATSKASFIKPANQESAYKVLKRYGVMA